MRTSLFHLENQLVANTASEGEAPHRSSPASVTAINSTLTTVFLPRGTGLSQPHLQSRATPSEAADGACTGNLSPAPERHGC